MSYCNWHEGAAPVFEGYQQGWVALFFFSSEASLFLPFYFVSISIRMESITGAHMSSCLSVSIYFPLSFRLTVLTDNENERARGEDEPEWNAASAFSSSSSTSKALVTCDIRVALLATR